MQVRPHEFEPERRGDPPEEKDARPAMRAAPTRDDEDARSDEPMEEPGYGHGV